MATKSDSAANVLKHGYEASVKARALARAGACNNLNGHILEIMGADKTNLKPLNIVRGVHEKLTSSTTARVVSGGISAVTNVIAVCNGEKDGWEATGCIVKDTAGGALSGAGAAAAATATGGLVAAGVAGTALAGTAVGAACVVGAPVVAALGVGYAISSIWKRIFN